MNAILQTLINKCKAEWATVDRIPMDAANKLIDLLDRAPKDALIIMVRERINFMYWPARRRLAEDHGMTDAQINAL